MMQANRSPRRILFLEKGLLMGGSHVSLYHLVRALETRRFQPVVLCYTENRFTRWYRENGIECIVWTPPRRTAPTSPLKRTIRRLLNQGGAAGSGIRFRLAELRKRWTEERASALGIAGLIRDRRIDLVHCNNGTALCADGVRAALAAEIPVISYERGLRRLSRYERRLARRVSLLVCNSLATLEHYRSQGIPTIRSVCVYNGVPLEEYDPGMRPTLEQRGDLTLGIFGRIIDWKGHSVFLEAAAALAPRFLGAVFCVVGEGPLEESAREQARRLGIADRVVFTGRRDDVAGVMAAMDVVVHASTAPEPFGRVILEAMAMGKPVVATDLGGPRELVEEGRSGFLVPPSDPKAVARRLNEILQNPRLRREMGRRARRIVEERFTISETVGRMEEIYAGLLGDS
jgi:glycosyltransferase involved in cell wall biosynthesis